MRVETRHARHRVQRVGHSVLRRIFIPHRRPQEPLPNVNRRADGHTEPGVPFEPRF